MANHLKDLVEMILSAQRNHPLTTIQDDTITHAVEILKAIPCEHRPEGAFTPDAELKRGNMSSCDHCSIPLKRVWVVDEL